MSSFTLVDEGTPHVVGAHFVNGIVWLKPEGVQRALDWELKPEGLCRGDVCIPVPEAVLAHGGISLKGLANALERPVATSLTHEVAYLGPPRPRFSETVGLLEAPDFTLPDIHGKPHSLSEHRGKKVLLAAWASW